MTGAARFLEGERAAARLVVDSLRAELDSIIGAQEDDPPDDEHDIEGSSVGFERARVTALLAQAEARVAELDAAAERLADGSYGVCSACGGPIGDERLAALPAADRCVGCAAAGAARRSL